MRKFILLIGMLLSSFLLHAQKNYAVMVTDLKTGNPIAGASVKIRSTGKTIATSGSGNVIILASPDDTLQIHFKGYNEREIQLAGQSVAIRVEMYPKPKVTPGRRKKVTKVM
jgi:hypothetical protein